jgi:hypothetical protein
MRDRLALTIIFCGHELCHVKDGGVHNFKKRPGTSRKVNESLGAPVMLIIFKDVCTLTHDFSSLKTDKGHRNLEAPVLLVTSENLRRAMQSKILGYQEKSFELSKRLYH